MLRGFRRLRRLRRCLLLRQRHYWLSHHDLGTMYCHLQGRLEALVNVRHELWLELCSRSCHFELQFMKFLSEGSRFTQYNNNSWSNSSTFISCIYYFNCINLRISLSIQCFASKQVGCSHFPVSSDRGIYSTFCLRQQRRQN